jgi:CRP-like cAMP-binding protein
MDILSSCYLFKGLSPQQIDDLGGIAIETSVAEKTWLFHEGKEADKLYFLIEGAVELVTTIDNDIELPIIKLNSAGDCLGTGMLVEPFEYSLSARSIEAASLLTISRQDLLKIEEKDGGFKQSVMENLATHYLSRLKETRQELKIHFKILFKAMRF